jgi:hypothetical protein
MLGFCRAERPTRRMAQPNWEGPSQIKLDLNDALRRVLERTERLI